MLHCSVKTECWTLLPLPNYATTIMKKIEFITRTVANLKRKRLRLNDFGVLCAMATLNHKHGSSTVPMVKDAIEDTNVYKNIEKLLELHLISETDRLPKADGLRHHPQTITSFVITKKGMDVLMDILEGGAA